ncbi:PepSY-associated TM helix domain-containing protein [Croceibacterium ferulae]|uniref:PepSY-associated TM helix domain-containing protein n=1 Tax=Croceibacterium ferulae TaxID=1854641 RepID=UPI000EB217AB|nr:PepSY-associated TM helix domain-containing protein [Croceibacterium ferulae]
MATATPSSPLRTALSAHSAVGLIVGALLYIVCVTGTLVVFYPEMQRLEQLNAPEMATIAPAAVQRGVAEVLAREQAEGVAPTTHMYVHLPVPDLPRATITTDTQAFHLAADGRVAMPEQIGWSDWAVKLHYGLSLPGLWGFVLVGVLGVMMLSLSLSGVLALPRILRDAFRLKARSPGGVALADWHNRLGTWTLPFAVAIAFTGAAIGVGSLGTFTLAQTEYDGDVLAVYAPIFGGEEPGDPRDLAVPDVAAALRHMQARHPEVTLTYAILHDPLQAGQHIQIAAAHDRRLIFGEYYDFDARGTFRGTAGLADGAAGQQAAASIYNLHFGNFGGLAVKMAYFVGGLAVSVIAATGTFIWLGKRRRRGMREPRLHAAWHGVVWGTPAMLALTFAARAAGGNDAPFDLIFWGGLLLCVGGAAMRAGREQGRAASLPEAGVPAT